VITIGIDPHKSSVTAVAVDLAGYELGQICLPVSKELGGQSWLAQAWPDRQWAVEGATGLGRGVAQLLASGRQRVLDVPAKLAARARLLGSGSARKIDVTDAASVAAVAQRNQRLRMVQAEDHTVILRLLSDHRDHLVAERTRTLNRLHVLLRDLHPGGAKRDLSTIQAAALLRLIRPLTPVDKQRKVLARDLLADLRRLGTTIKAHTKSLTTALDTAGSTLTDVHGLGPVLAAKILAHSGDITRFPSRHHYASYCGTAPIEASSGDQRRHRLSRAGNRQLNAAVHVIAVCQARDPGPGRNHYQRKLTESKTPAEAPAQPQTPALQRHLQASARRPPTCSPIDHLTHRGAIKSRRSARTR
jgi:transposase